MRKLFAALVIGSATAFASGQSNQPADAGSRTETIAAPGEGEGEAGKGALPFAVEAEVNVPSAYYFRGYRYIDSGYLIQPEITLSLNEPLEAGGVSATPYVTVWSNISELTGPRGSWDHLNEVDVIPGIELNWDKFPQWTLELQYNANFFPSGIPERLRGLDGQSQEIGFTLTLDDSQWTKQVLPFALNPHVSYFWEVEDRSDHSLDSYLELGTEPEFKLTEKLSVSVPAVLGMSTDSYYVDREGHNDFLGYASIGLYPKYQFSEHWDVHARLDYLYLISDLAVSTNDGDRNVFIGTVGLGMSY